MLRDPAVLVPVLCAATVVILLISAVSLLFMRNRRCQPRTHGNEMCKCKAIDVGVCHHLLGR